MKYISNYNSYLKEALEDNQEGSIDVVSNINDKDYSDIKEELMELVKKSANSTDETVVNDFISAYKKSPNDTQIEGLINDSDVYEFYLKWRNDIDDILSDINFFDDVPSDSNVFSLYDFIIVGTKKAVSEIL